jgi:hypothetical protein
MPSIIFISKYNIVRAPARDQLQRGALDHSSHVDQCIMMTAGFGAREMLMQRYREQLVAVLPKTRGYRRHLA